MSESSARTPPKFGNLQPHRNLVIVHQPGWSDPSDWEDIAGRISRRAPDLDVFIVDATAENARIRDAAARAPTLVFSPGAMPVFRPLRGRVYAGQRVAKAEQLRRLAAVGVPVPKWRLLGPDDRFVATGWSGHVVVKPADGQSSNGAGVQVLAAEALHGRSMREFAPGTPLSTGRMIVQQFVENGADLAYWRLLALFGRPLYCARIALREPVRLTADGVPAEGEPVTTHVRKAVDKVRAYISDPEILALAPKCHEALPGAPLHGIDVLRCVKTGQLYVLEVNPGGNTWHFSSGHIREQGQNLELETARREQFDAFSVAADVLIERTRAEAV